MLCSHPHVALREPAALFRLLFNDEIYTGSLIAGETTICVSKERDHSSDYQSKRLSEFFC